MTRIIPFLVAFIVFVQSAPVLANNNLYQTMSSAEVKQYYTNNFPTQTGEVYEVPTLGADSIYTGEHFIAFDSTGHTLYESRTITYPASDNFPGGELSETHTYSYNDNIELNAIKTLSRNSMSQEMYLKHYEFDLDNSIMTITTLFSPIANDFNEVDEWSPEAKSFDRLTISPASIMQLPFDIRLSHLSQNTLYPTVNYELDMDNNQWYINKLDKQMYENDYVFGSVANEYGVYGLSKESFYQNSYEHLGPGTYLDYSYNNKGELSSVKKYERDYDGGMGFDFNTSFQLTETTNYYYTGNHLDSIAGPKKKTVYKQAENGVQNIYKYTFHNGQTGGGFEQPPAVSRGWKITYAYEHLFENGKLIAKKETTGSYDWGYSTSEKINTISYTTENGFDLITEDPKTSPSIGDKHYRVEYYKDGNLVKILNKPNPNYPAEGEDLLPVEEQVMLQNYYSNGDLKAYHVNINRTSVHFSSKNEAPLALHNQNNIANYQVVPTISNGEITIQATMGEKYNVELVSVQGKVISQTENLEGPQQLSLGKEKGLYFVNITSLSNQKHVFKVIKQ